MLQGEDLCWKYRQGIIVGVYELSCCSFKQAEGCRREEEDAPQSGPHPGEGGTSCGPTWQQSPAMWEPAAPLLGSLRLTEMLPWEPCFSSGFCGLTVLASWSFLTLTNGRDDSLFSEVNRI